MLAVVIAILAKLVVNFRIRIEERIKKDNKSHIFKHLHSTTTCFESYKSFCFKIIVKANSKFDLKINGEFILIKNVLKEYDEMKEEIKN